VINLRGMIPAKAIRLGRALVDIHHRTSRVLLASGALAAALLAPEAHGATDPPLTTAKGVVAADHAEAAAVGAEVLARGGNAADAAAATAFAGGVVQAASSGIGGGGFALVYVAKEKRVYALDFREVAPSALTPDHFVRDGKVVPTLAAVGGLAVAVPGEVAGLVELVERFGRSKLRDVVRPAQTRARSGFVVGDHLAETAAFVASNTDSQAFRSWLAPNGRTMAAGQRVRRPLLARALSEIGRKGAPGFYRGWVAADIVKSVQDKGGVMTTADLERYKVIERVPLTGTWRGKRIVTMPLPSSGGLIALASLGMLDRVGHDLAVAGWGSSQAFHLIAEVLKHGFADRARLFGDATSSQIAPEQFLATARLQAMAERITRFTTRDHDTYGDRSLGQAAPVTDDGGTSHICAIDKEGNAVSLTTTINRSFGAQLVGARSGIVLNNEIDDFAVGKDVPNQFGLVQSEANLVGGGKRPLSSMTPVLVFESDRVVACAGGSGGPRIISNVVQVLLNLYVFDMDVRAAVSAPRIHHQWVPDKLLVEAEVPRDVASLLRARGHRIEHGWRSASAVQAVVVRPDGTRQAASDPRKGGAPAAEK
jgi:gamma-glutamyltranspeptidase / glutathione hydrolase